MNINNFGADFDGDRTPLMKNLQRWKEVLRNQLRISCIRFWRTELELANDFKHKVEIYTDLG